MDSKMTQAQKTALKFIASGLSWEQFAVDNDLSHPPTYATYHALVRMGKVQIVDGRFTVSTN